MYSSLQLSHTASKLPVVVPIENKKDSAGNTLLDGNVLLGNITCVSKARLGDYITELTAAEMKEVDKAISLSLDVYHYYQTILNIYNDKLLYIDKLKEHNTTTQKKLDTMQETINQINQLLKQYNFVNICELSEFLEKTNAKK